MTDSERKDEAQSRLARLCELYGLVEGAVYAHHNGGYYVIRALSIDEATYEPLVTYRSNLKGTSSTRTLWNFVEGVDGDPRYRRVAE